MERHELINGYLQSLKYYIWISDLYHQLSAWQFQASFWIHASVIFILLVATISSFFKYRYDQSFFKEIIFSNFIVYLPLSLIFCYMLLQQFSIRWDKPLPGR